MSRIRACLTSCIIAGGVISVGATTASAQSFETAGVIRVSDSPNPQPISASTAVDPNCPSGNCPNGTSAYAGEYYGGHGRHGRHGGDGYRFSPPVKRPIYRSPVSYTKGFPDQWTGNAPVGHQTGYRAPTVYMPTDTTQLGYYYQVVPYWQPKHGAVPPPPIPSQWHTTVGQLPQTGNCPAGVIYGTAPTAVPNSPTPPPWGDRGVPPEPQPTQVQGVNGSNIDAQPTPLERTGTSPSLLPIE